MSVNNNIGGMPKGFISMNRYQELAHETAIHSPSSVPTIAYNALGLAGEAGEVANKVKKIYRDDGDTVTDERREMIKKELGGVLWYLSELSLQLGFNLGEVAIANLKLLKEREANGTIHGDEDDR
jgi:NTP pyrophosphatase (non-canonical NTP hydrolase)